MKNRSMLSGKAALSGFLLLLLSLVSCRSRKELMYLRDIRGEKQTLDGLPATAPMYRLKPRDNLFISIVSPNADLNKVYNPYQVASNNSGGNHYENLSGQYIHGYEVDADGFVSLPVIGRVKLVGKTIPESQQELESRAQMYLKQTTVKVRLLNFKVTVLGEVKNPGVYYAYGYSCSALDALGMANGCTEFASLDNVTVLRPNPRGSTTYHLNFNSTRSLGSEGFYLQPNDVLFVQPARNKFIQPRMSGITIALGAVSSVLLLLNYLK